MSLLEVIESHRQVSNLLPETKIRNFIYQLCNALEFIHSRGYMHRDVKPENILVTQDKLKLADFVLTRHLEGRVLVASY